MHTIVTTSVFDRQADRCGLTESEIAEIVAFLAANPTAGDVMVGTGGARKVRFARAGGGKSGGYRTIHFYGGVDIPIFLLGVIDKRQTGNLTKAERNQLAAILDGMVKAYRSRLS